MLNSIQQNTPDKMKFRNVSTEVEEEIKIDKTLDEVLKKCKTIDDNRSFMTDLDLPVLNPSQINLFFNILVKENEGSELNNGEDAFLNELIHTSWRYGHNNFKFNNPINGKFNFLLSNLKGEKDNPIIISFNGNGGKAFAFSSINCIYNLSGKFYERFGTFSKNCTYNIHGEIKERFLDEEYTLNTFNLFKKVKKIGIKEGGSINDCTLNVYEGIDEVMWNSIRNCTFRTPDSKIYKNLISSFRKYKIESEFKLFESKWYEKITKSFKEDSKIVEEVFFQKYNKYNLFKDEYNKIQLIK